MKFNKYERAGLILSIIGLATFNYGIEILNFLKIIGFQNVFWVLSAFVIFRRAVITTRINIKKLKLKKN